MVRRSIEKLVIEEYGGRMPTRREVHNTLLSLPEDDFKYWVILAYLLGGRISELCYYRTRKWLIFQGERVPNPGYTENPIVGLHKKNVLNFHTNKEGKKFLVVFMRNEKNPKSHTKKVPIPIDKEAALVAPLIKWLEGFNDDEVLFPHYRNYYYTRVKKYLPEYHYPHFFRSLRATHLVTEYSLNTHQLKKVMGWKRDDMANWYVNLDVKDLMDVM